MTEESARVERATRTGAVQLLVQLTAGEVEVRAAHTDVAEVRLEPVMPGDEVAAELIDRAKISTVDGRFSVRVPQPAHGVTNVVAGRQVGIQAVSGQGNIVVGNNIYGGVVMGGNMYVGDGGVRVGGVNVGGSVAIGGAVRVIATVPSGSDVSGRTVSADMRVTADPEATTRTHVGKVVFNSTSGNLETVGAHRIEATTVSGDITAEGAKAMNISSTSGDVRAESLAGNLFARTISGDIRAHAVADCTVQAESVSGDVTVNRERGLTVNVSARSVSGRVRT